MTQSFPLPFPHLPALQPLATTSLFSVCTYLPILDISYNRIIHSLWDWAFSLSIIFSVFISLWSAYLYHTFLYGWIILHCMHRPHLLTHLSVGGHLGHFYFWFLWITQLWILYWYLSESIFHSFGYILRSGIGGWWDNSVSNLPRNSGCTILHLTK